MVARWAFLLAVTALGACRIHFDPVEEAAGDATLADTAADMAVDTLVLPPTSVTFEDNALSTANATVYTFTNIAFGPASVDRLLVLAVLSNSPNDITSITIGATTATRAVMYNPAGDSAVSAIYYAPFPTGTTGTVVVNVSAGGATRCAIGVYRVEYRLQTAPTSVSGTTSWVGASSVQVPRLADGVGIWMGQRDGTTAFTPTIDNIAPVSDGAGLFGSANFYWTYGSVTPTTDGMSSYAADFGADNGIVIAAYFR